MNTIRIELSDSQYIEITVDGTGGGSITSEGLKLAEGLSEDIEDGEEVAGRDMHNAAIDGMESLILAMACEGVVPTKMAIQTALDAIGNNYG